MDNPPQLRPAFLIADSLNAVARESARRMKRVYLERTRPRVGATLRPGPHTPLWNALVACARSHLRRRGEKALLARLLGVPRQRVHDYLVGRGRMPDAERTLLLMGWIAARRGGIKPS